VLDGGSTDDSLRVIREREARLSWWHSGPDAGQSAAINEGIARSSARYVAWLNADDMYLPNGLSALVRLMESAPLAPAAYGRSLVRNRAGRARGSYRTGPFNRDRLARRCFISQPATIIRRQAWETVGGLDAGLHMALDYDLWWRLTERFGPMPFLDQAVAMTRNHAATKTVQHPLRHYQEALAIVKRYYGYVPASWYWKAPFSVGARLAWSVLAGRRSLQR
jgi:GT2 family glycosyltransferase